MSYTAIVDQYRARYLDAALAGDPSRAAAVVDDALRHGIGTASIYLDVIVPAQEAVGDRWHRGETNVAQEHAATQIALTQMQRLRAGITPRSPSGPRAVVAAVEDELHDLGARVVADFLTMDGWDVAFLGASTPTSDLVAYVRMGEPALVALSVTMPELLGGAARAIAALRGLEEPPRIILGGGAVREDGAQALAAGADAVTGDAWDAVHHARALLGGDDEPVRLEKLLHDLGNRIRALRRERRWSQQQLGTAAGLDRTYINSVEQGKQNLTLAAVLRLANALEVAPDQLLFARTPLPPA